MRGLAASPGTEVEPTCSNKTILSPKLLDDLPAMLLVLVRPVGVVVDELDGRVQRRLPFYPD